MLDLYKIMCVCVQYYKHSNIYCNYYYKYNRIENRVMQIIGAVDG